MLAAVELDNQAPVATNKIDVVPADWLLADEFEAAELTTSDARHNANSAGVSARRSDRARTVRV